MIAPPSFAAAKTFAELWWKLALGLVLGGLLVWGPASCIGRQQGRADLLAEQALASQQATNRADEDEQGRRDANQNRADAIEGVIRNAVADDPEGTNRAAGRATSDVLNELRRRPR